MLLLLSWLITVAIYVIVDVAVVTTFHVDDVNGQQEGRSDAALDTSCRACCLGYHRSPCPPDCWFPPVRQSGCWLRLYCFVILVFVWPVDTVVMPPFGILVFSSIDTGRLTVAVCRFSPVPLIDGDVSLADRATPWPDLVVLLQPY